MWVVIQGGRLIWISGEISFSQPKSRSTDEHTLHYHFNWPPKQQIFGGIYQNHPLGFVVFFKLIFEKHNKKHKKKTTRLEKFLGRHHFSPFFVPFHRKKPLRPKDEAVTLFRYQVFLGVLMFWARKKWEREWWNCHTFNIYSTYIYNIFMYLHTYFFIVYRIWSV